MQREGMEVTRERSPIYGCAGAIDGIATKVVKPWAGTTANSSTSFASRWILRIQCVIATTSLPLRRPSALVRPMTLPPSLYLRSRHFEAARMFFLLPGFWIPGDEAYICEGRMLTPWPGRSLPQEHDCFNYWLSSAKFYIEQAFGMSIGR
jgi:hypothetical protein